MNNPMHQFEIHKIYDLQLFGIDISVTNSTVFMLIATALIIAVLSLGIRKGYHLRQPNKAEVVSEQAFNFVANLVDENCGSEARRYLPFVMSFFMLIAMGNVLGMVPYTFTFTSHIIVTFAMAAMVFIVITIIGFMHHGLGYLKIFLPDGAPLFLAPILIPIELISYLSRPISLSVRLFANIMAGHIVLKIFAGFIISLGIVGGVIPLGMTVLLTFFEVFVALVQAYIFAILTCVYLNDALHLH
ncbi:F0F1 ATP synthase subunit A [Candidatus Bodocaedibacter vickermanii]|uniref:ATP synthase subunit a n=1 Tax=Candidatus Bodocaedibacter vickermanii TaxID=2741701 RepID=A0A7L9RT64_9PROT|nr:ATP synthase subunit a [Candidatus Paracaedibacteraceae bacterium 'Lake Konstanz']